MLEAAGESLGPAAHLHQEILHLSGYLQGKVREYWKMSTHTWHLALLLIDLVIFIATSIIAPITIHVIALMLALIAALIAATIAALMATLIVVLIIGFANFT